MNRYTFYDEGYYFSNGCSCCEATYMECFNSEDTDCNLGSAGSIEDCYVQAILTEIGRGNVPEDYEDFLYQMSLEELKEEAKNLNIEVEIVS